MKRICALVLLIGFALCFSACGIFDEGDDMLSADDMTADQSNVSESSDYSEAENTLVFADSYFANITVLKYVAFGDSIARGYGLETPESESYPALFASALDVVLDGVAIDFTNYGVDGYTTSDLLELLNSDSVDYSNADLITLCIGSNNILGPFNRATKEYFSHISGVVKLEGDIKSQLASLAASLNEFKAYVESDEFVNEMKSGINLVGEEYPLILDAIYSKAPDAKIMVMTVYSPYNGIDITIPYIGIDFDLGMLSDKWVSLLNEKIRAAALDKGCILVDTYDSFAEAGGLVNAKIDIMGLSISFDPHPNHRGHIALSNLHMDALYK